MHDIPFITLKLINHFYFLSLLFQLAKSIPQILTLCILQTPKRVLWLTVKTYMKCSIMSHVYVHTPGVYVNTTDVSVHTMGVHVHSRCICP